jgi:serine/threonine protein kinase/TolA-binding protein
MREPANAGKMATSMIGQTVAHYRVVEQLGAGGMGVVYRAEDLRLGRAVALKFLPPQLSRDRTAAERFEREARTASSLNHPNICTIYGVDEFEGQRFIAMELLDGHSLGAVIADRPLPIDRVLELGIQIADALDAAHAQGILHRDIKPANIFVTRRGQAKVLDFGLAKLAAAPLGDGTASADSPTIDGLLLSTQGMALGTVAYMSPEQARGEPLDARTDLFSFGIVLYEMATGHQAFQGQTSAVVFDNLLNRQPPPTVAIRADVPPQLDQIISKALEKDPSLRYQTASDLLADLKRLKRDRESGRMPVSGAAVVAGGPPSSPSVGAASVSAHDAASQADVAASGAKAPARPAAASRAPAARRASKVTQWAAGIAVLLLLAAVAATIALRTGRTPGAPTDAGAESNLLPDEAAAADQTPATDGALLDEELAAGGEAALEEGDAADSASIGVNEEAPPARPASRADRTQRRTPPAEAAPSEPTPLPSAPAVAPVASVTVAPDPAATLLGVAQAKIAARLFDQAAADLESLVARHPSSASAPAALLALAGVRVQQARPDDAMGVYVEIRSRYRETPAAAEAGVRFAELLLRSNRPDRVKVARETLAAVARDHAETAWAPRALAAKGDLEDREKIREHDPQVGAVVPAALVTWRDLADRYPGAASAEETLWKLGTGYEELRRYDFAAQTFVALATRFPKTRYDAWWKAAELYDRRLRNRDAAQDAYARVPPSSRNHREAQKRSKR